MDKKYIIILWSTLLLVLTACTIPSGENVFTDEAEEEQTAIEKSEVTLEEAIENTASDLLERFWFRAHVANNIEKRRITHMTTNGIVIRPDGYYMNNSFITKPYEYYRLGDRVYVRNNENWFRGREPNVPFDPFYGFDAWLPVADRATLLREDDVLSIPTVVYEIELTGDEFLQLHPDGFEQLPEEMKTMKPLLDETNVRTLFYVGQTEKGTDDLHILPVIYKYETWIQMPVPGAGYMEQEIQHFIFRVNEESVEMPDVDEIERYLIDIDESKEEMENQLEQMEKEVEKDKKNK